MELEAFKKEKIEGRELIFQGVMEMLKSLEPVAIHQFGSGRSGYRDEFSDFDLWITFPDDKIKEIVDNREELFSKVGSILVKSDASRNAPLGGGSYTLVLYDTDHGLYHVDYYFAPKSGNRVRDDAICIYGDDSLPRGEWTTDKDNPEKWTPEHVYDQMMVMSYILNKAIVRGGWNVDMTNYLRELYRDYQDITHQTSPPLPESADFVFIHELYRNIEPYANKNQEKAIKKLGEYSKLVERLYT